MRRREFIAALGGAAAWPVVARAQQPAKPVIGFMSARSPEDTVEVLKAFHNGLEQGGFIEVGTSISNIAGHAATIAVCLCSLTS